MTWPIPNWLADSSLDPVLQRRVLTALRDDPSTGLPLLPADLGRPPQEEAAGGGYLILRLTEAIGLAAPQPSETVGWIATWAERLAALPPSLPRLGALHAAARMLELAGRYDRSAALDDLAAEWLPSVAGEPADALLPLLLIDDLPAGLEPAALRLGPPADLRGAYWSAARLQIRAVDRLIRFAPPAAFRLPLLHLADPASGRVPWLEAWPEDDGVGWAVEHEELLTGWELLPRLPGE